LTDEAATAHSPFITMNLRRFVSAPAKLLSLILTLLCPASSTVAAIPGDEHWDNQFGPVGVNDVAQSVVAQGNKVFVGGNLTAAGNTRANGIAGYDGTNWFALNKGVAGDFNFTHVFALASDPNYVYAGGNFTNADNSGARSIARWNGANWSSMGAELNGYVFTLKTVGTICTPVESLPPPPTPTPVWRAGRAQVG
jgi:hypothetical protein